MDPKCLNACSKNGTTNSDFSCNYLPKPSAEPPNVTIPEKQATLATNTAKKIRRALSIPRNPFRWSRKFKTVTDFGESKAISDNNFDMTSCVGGGRGRAGSIISLSSLKACTKDTNGNLQAQANAGKLPVATAIGCIEKENGMVERNIEKGTFNSGGDNTSNRILRRSSFRKFISRIAKHISLSVNFGANKTSSSNLSCAYTSATTYRRPTISVMDRVPPIGGQQWPGDQTPGVMGLKNHGNTCFMNAVLQCLSHTDILAEYFVLDQYKADLKRRNKINSRKFGTKGELTEQLANVLKALWTCKNESDHSTSFKAVVERYGSQFRSSTQHDAQEFLFWLLDKVHEDLNTATKRRYKSVKNTYGRPDDVIAAETLANHIRCNNSFVQAVFQAQFRSSLTCPRCKKQSNTFDPFHCISVQLPQFTQQTIFVTVVYKEREPRQMKLGVLVPAGSPIVALRERLHAETGIRSDRMVLVDMSKEGFTRVFHDSQPVSTLANIETTYCIEVGGHEVQSNMTSHCEVVTVSAQMTSSMMTGTDFISTVAMTPAEVNYSSSSLGCTDILLLITNVRKFSKAELTFLIEQSAKVEDLSGETVEDESNVERFGTPFSLLVPRDCSYTDLQKKLIQAMSPHLKSNIFSNNIPLMKVFQVRLQDPSADADSYLEQVQHPLLTEMIDLALSVLSPEAGPAHIKLVVEWSNPELYFTDITDTVVQHESVARLLKRKTNETATLSLEQCLEHYTKAETLSAEDAWRCPHCQQYLPVVKTLGLWSLPDILIVHFKRFRQHQGRGHNAAKLTTMVKFPLNAFDMAPHLARSVMDKTNQLTFGSNSLITDAMSSIYRASTWRRTRTNDSRSSTLSSQDNKDTLYDLYAVCYHQGDTLETGHYTAACKNPYDRQWYKFDDQRVCKVPNESIQEEIINNEAYMLFYQRRVSEITECSGSSSSSGDHWVSRIAPPLTTANKKGTDRPYQNGIQSSVAAVTTKSDYILDGTEANLEEFAKIEENAEIKQQDIKPSNRTNQEIHKTFKNKDHIEKLDYTYSEFTTNCANINTNPNNIDGLNELKKIGLQVGDICTSEDNNSIFVMDEDYRQPRDAGLHDEKQDLCFEKNAIDIGVNNFNKPTTKLSAVLPTVVGTKTPIPTTLATEHGTSFIPTNVLAVAELIQTSRGSKNMASQSNSELGSSFSSLSSRSSPNSLRVSLDRYTNLQSNRIDFSGSLPLNNSYNERLLSSSLKTNRESGVSTAAVTHLNEFRHANYKLHHCNGSRSHVLGGENAIHQGHPMDLRHSFSTSSKNKLRDCSDTLSSMLRNSANNFSKDTLIFIDEQNHHSHLQRHSLMESDENTFLEKRSLWISPVTPHKLITVSPKN